MKEPRIITFDVFKCQSKSTRERCEKLNSELAEIFKRREGYLATCKATPTAGGKSTFEQSYVARDAKGHWVDTHATENELLKQTGEFVESLIGEAIENVRKCECNSETAFARIKAEIDAYGLIWQTDHQFNLFVRRSTAMRPFETLVVEAKSFESASRNLVQEIKNRIAWLTAFVIQERSHLVFAE